MSHFGHCLQCLSNIVGIVRSVHAITVGIAYNGYHTHTHTYTHIYIYMCMCVCVYYNASDTLLPAVFIT